jgi:signal transduction histidine kinase
MNALRSIYEAIKATLQRLNPFARRSSSAGKHALAFQRLFFGALAGSLMAFFFGDSPLLENLELGMLEWRYKLAEQLSSATQPGPHVSKDIAIVAFDDSAQFDLSCPRFNDPVSQGRLAYILERIESGEPALVAVDLDLRGTPNPDLVRLFQRYRNVILAVFGSMEGSSDLPDTEFLKHAAGYGYDELIRENNGSVLRMTVNTPNEMGSEAEGLAQVPSLTEAIMAAYRQQKGLSGSDPQLQSVTPDQPVYINFKKTEYPIYSMSALLDGEFNPEKFHDKIVLVAPTLTSKRIDASHVITPLRGLSPEVYVHADALNTLLNNEIIFSFPKPIAHHILMLLGALFGALSSILPMGKRALFCLLGGMGLVVLAQFNFQILHVTMPVVAPLAMLLSGFILGTVIYLDTDLRQRNRELAAAREHMQIRAEEERKRIAGDLHDETLPALSAVARMVDELFKVQDPRESTVPERMRLKLDATIQEMRRVINDLHPSVLETMGFVPALENLAVILEKDIGITYSFVDRNGKDDYEISDFAKLQLYRIVQEALNNVGKHSQASEVAVRIQTIHDSLEISISDNGRGINPKLIRKDSHGLLNIKHRAQLVGATVEWRKPQQYPTGTELRVSMPLVESEVHKNGNGSSLTHAPERKEHDSSNC